jgi:phosphatidate cytidylyltransferase
VKKFLVRAASGLVYVILTLGAILMGKTTFLIYFLFVLLFSTYEYYRMCHNRSIRPQVATGLIVSAAIFLSVYAWQFNYIEIYYLPALLPLFLLIPAVELLMQKEHAAENIAFTILGITIIALPFSVLNLIVTPPVNQASGVYFTEPLIGLLILLWANDTGAYLVGSQIGKHKMAVKISPNKTWEGAIGGALFTMAISILLWKFSEIFTLTDALILSLITVVFGTLGDLTESLIKRRFGVKDSGTIMPGHGGLLDRFDSLLFAAPMYYLYIFITLN